MPAAMHLTVLISLFAVAACQSSTTSSITTRLTEVPTSTEPFSSLSTDVSSSSLKTSHMTQEELKPPVAVTSAVSSAPPPSTAPQTPYRTEGTRPSTPAQTTISSQTSNEAVSLGSTVSPNTTVTPNVNTTNPEGDPGLVAIICIFCIVLVLAMFVAVVKCIQSPRSDFERLEDVPMGRVNEGSPFAQYSK